jgi:hypothetical protein
MSAMDRDLRLLKQKIDLLIDGYQILYMKLDQQTRLLKRMESRLGGHGDEDPLALTDRETSNVVRMSERFLSRVRRAHDGELDPEEPQPS